MAYLGIEVLEGKEEFLVIIYFLCRTRLAYSMYVDSVISIRFIRIFWRTGTAVFEAVDGVTRIIG